MIDQRFRAAFQYTFKNEVGDDEDGFTNDPIDRGGPTRYGITLNTLARWRAPKVVTEQDVRELSIDETQDIYFAWYWLAAGCDRIDYLGPAIALFDNAVLMGPNSAVMRAQMSLNRSVKSESQIREDGRIGPSTIAAINRLSPDVFIASFQVLLSERVAAIIQKHPEQNRFERGWLARIKRLDSLKVGPASTGTV